MELSSYESVRLESFDRFLKNVALHCMNSTSVIFCSTRLILCRSYSIE